MRHILGFVAFLSLAAAASGAVIHVPARGNLQTAIDQAQLGDTITLQPGATYTVNIVLKTKPGSDYLTIMTLGTDNIAPPGKRVNPTVASSFARLVSPNNTWTVKTAPGAHHYRLAGLEICAAPGIYSNGIVHIGMANADTKLSDLASDVELDRVYIHGDPNVGGKVGVALNAIDATVKNSYISNIKSTKAQAQDTQAISGHNGPGPFLIENNYLEAAAENIMFGAATPSINGMVPSDITIRKNHIAKNPAWKSQNWWVKNLIEFKSARRVLIEGNVIENNWVGADQWAYALVLTARTVQGKVPWAVVEDITIKKNIVRNAGGGVNILGRDYFGGNMGAVRNVVFEDNLFYDIDVSTWGGKGNMFLIQSGPSDVTINHNTLLQSPTNANMIMFNAEPPISGFQFKNNVADNGKFGMGGALAHYAPGAVFQKNAIIAGNSTKYPAGNFFPANHGAVGFIDEPHDDYELAPGSPYKNAGTDGQDLGADIPAVMSATAGVTSGKPAGGQAPAAVSVSPSGSQGSSQVFQFVYSDDKGFDNITSAFMLFNASTSHSNGCSIKFDAVQNSFSLRDDSGSGWFGPVAAGSGGGLSNSQCTVSAANSSAGGSGKNLQVVIDISFAPAFTGEKKIYMYATNKDNLTGALLQKGTWTPYLGVVNNPPTAVSVLPNSGAGLNKVFTFLYADPQGAADLKQVLALFSTASTAQANACYIQYVPATNEIFLRDDAGTTWLGPGRLTGNPGSLQNRQCKLDTGVSTASGSGTNLTLALSVSFKIGFAGAKTIFMSATDQANATTNWQSRGTWTVRNSAPTAVSVTPPAASGVSTTARQFALLYSDADGYQDIETTFVLINATTNLANGCYMQYVRELNQLWLRNDAGTAWLGPISPGAAGTIQNSRCVVSAATASTGSGPNLGLTIAASFKNTWIGKKNIYMKVADTSGAASPLVLKGNYAILK